MEFREVLLEVINLIFKAKRDGVRGSTERDPEIAHNLLELTDIPCLMWKVGTKIKEGGRR